MIEKKIKGLKEIYDKYDVFFIDLWGVVHNGIQLYPEAIEVLENLYKLNKRFVLMSNAPRPSKNVENFLLDLKMNKIFAKNIFTSGEAALKSLQQGVYGKNFYHIGPERDNSLFKEFEKNKTKGFGWLEGNIEKINYIGKDNLGRNLKIPHMGWNNLEIYKTNHAILKNITEFEQFYFVHSYYLNTFKKDQILADTNYNHKIPAIIGKDNYIGVQFHPEKSSTSGLKIITNWLKWKP